MSGLHVQSMSVRTPLSSSWHKPSKAVEKSGSVWWGLLFWIDEARLDSDAVLIKVLWITGPSYVYVHVSCIYIHMNHTFVAHLGDAVLGHEVGGLRVDEALVKPSLPGRRGARLDSD
jgi:hypothetical protein